MKRRFGIALASAALGVAGAMLALNQRYANEDKNDQIGIGHSTTYWTVAALLWCAGILVVFSFLATRRFSKMR